jgi:hypothetical protein
VNEARGALAPDSARQRDEPRPRCRPPVQPRTRIDPEVCTRFRSRRMTGGRRFRSAQARKRGPLSAVEQANAGRMVRCHKGHKRILIEVLWPSHQAWVRS